MNTDMNIDESMMGYTLKIRISGASLAWIITGYERMIIAIAKRLTTNASSEDERSDDEIDFNYHTATLRWLDDLQTPINGSEDEIEIDLGLGDLRGFYCVVLAVAKNFERQLENDKLTIEERAVGLKNKASCDSLFAYLKQTHDSHLLLMPKE